MGDAILRRVLSRREGGKRPGRHGRGLHVTPIILGEQTQVKHVIVFAVETGNETGCLGDQALVFHRERGEPIEEAFERRCGTCKSMRLRWRGGNLCG